MSYSEQLWAKERLTEEQNRLVRKIVNQAQRTRDLVTDLLRFAQQSPGEKIPVDLYCSSAARNSDAGVAPSRRPHPRCAVDRRPTSHRCRAMPTSCSRRLLKSSRMPWMPWKRPAEARWKFQRNAQGNEAVLQFSDTGPGIRDPLRVFDPFYTTKPVGKGTGLGLSAVYGVIQDHSGQITCQNKPEGGALFIVRLPVAVEPAVKVAGAGGRLVECRFPPRSPVPSVVKPFLHAGTTDSRDSIPTLSSCTINCDAQRTHPQFRARAGVRLSPRTPARIRLFASWAGADRRARSIHRSRLDRKPAGTGAARFANSAAWADGSIFPGSIDIDLLVEKSRIAGAALETTEIRDVILLVDRAAEWREIVLHPPANMKSDWHGVRALSDQIVDFTEFLRSFRNKIQPDGTLEDKASPELARIRREIEKPAPLDSGIPARISAPARRRRHGAGRTGHHPRRTLCHPRESRAETPRARGGARRQFQRTDGLRRAARDHRTEQRTRAPAGRRAGGNSPHPAGDDPAHRRTGRGNPRSSRRAGRTGTAIRQSPIRRRLQLRSGQR